MQPEYQVARAVTLTAKAGTYLQQLAKWPLTVRRLRRIGGFLATSVNDLFDAAARSQVSEADARRLGTLLAEYQSGRTGGHGGAGLGSPAVTVSMVSRNRAYCIRDAIRSVQAQSFADWELVIIDDGSSDATREVVLTFSDDPRIRYVWQPPQGLPKGRNHSLRLARGALVAYLDDDNLFYRGFLESAVGVFVSDPGIDCLYGALVADDRSHHPRICQEAFDRERLRTENFIDMGAIVHRRSVIAEYGGIDEEIQSLCDWDFVLRVTQHKPATSLPVLSTRYRVMDANRMSEILAAGRDRFKIARKWFTTPAVARMPRVLLVAGSENDLRQRHVETLVNCMRRWGVEISPWAASSVSSDFRAAIDAAAPDVIHVLGAEWAQAHAISLADAGTPVTIGAAGPGAPAPGLVDLSRQAWVRRIYAPSVGGKNLRGGSQFRELAMFFDTSAFGPARDKDRRLVLQVFQALSDEAAESFFEMARRCPQQRFVLALVGADAGNRVVQPGGGGTQVQVLVDPPRAELIALQHRAGIYLETERAGDAARWWPRATAIAEAMATGAHVLLSGDSPVAGFVGEATQTYRDSEHAARLIATAAEWDDARWRRAWVRAVNQGFDNFADELVLRPLFEDWCRVLERYE